MKKIIALTLVAIMVVFGLVSCNKNDKDGDDTTVVTTTAADTTTTVEDTTEADTTVADDTDEIGDIVDGDEMGYETTVENDSIVFKSDYGFSFTYLAKYDEFSVIEDNCISFIVDEENGYMFDITASEYGDDELDISKDMDLTAYKSEIEEMYKVFDEEFAFSKFEETTVSGAKALVMEYDILGIDCEQIMVFGEENCYIITMTYEADSDFAIDFGASISSFELVK